MVDSFSKDQWGTLGSNMVQWIRNWTGSQEAWVLVLALPLTRWVTLGKSLCHVAFLWLCSPPTLSPVLDCIRPFGQGWLLNMSVKRAVQWGPIWVKADTVLGSSWYVEYLSVPKTLSWNSTPHILCNASAWVEVVPSSLFQKAVFCLTQAGLFSLHFWML